MKIEEKLLSINDMTRSGEKQNNIKKILICKIEKDVNTVNQCYKYLENLKYQDNIFSSYHYIVDEFGKILRITPEEEVTFAIGHHKFDNENISIGLSFIRYTKEIEKSLTDLINNICKKYNLVSKTSVVIENDLINTRNLSIYIDNKYILNSILNQCTR